MSDKGTAMERVAAVFEDWGQEPEPDFVEAVVDAVVNNAMARREFSELDEVAKARGMADKFDAIANNLPDFELPTPIAKTLRDLANKTEGFQRLWIEAVTTIREFEVVPLKERVEFLHSLIDGGMSTERMEEALALHYKEPVRPVRDFCQAFTDWHKVIGEKIRDLEAQGFEHASDCNLSTPPIGTYCSCGADLRRQEHSEWSGIYAHLNALQIPIYKSNFLHRRVYLGEGIRRIKCPDHKGRWSGCNWPGCNHCMSGINITGWVTSSDKEYPEDEPKAA